MQQMLL